MDQFRKDSPSRHPFEVLLFLAGFIAGVVVVFDLGRPQSLGTVVPTYWVVIWGWVLWLAGGVGLFAVLFMRDKVTSLLLERITLAGVGGAAFVYGLAAVTSVAGTSRVAGIFMLYISFASIWRIFQVSRELRRLGGWMDQHLNGE